jgi:hypothetical protein
MLAAILTQAQAMLTTPLNAANLEMPGADTLAALVPEPVQGNGARQHRAGLALSAAPGPTDVVARLRRRFAVLRRAGNEMGCCKPRGPRKDFPGFPALEEPSLVPQESDKAQLTMVAKAGAGGIPAAMAYPYCGAFEGIIVAIAVAPGQEGPQRLKHTAGTCADPDLGSRRLGNLR